VKIAGIFVAAPLLAHKVIAAGLVANLIVDI